MLKINFLALTKVFLKLYKLYIVKIILNDI